MKIFLALCIAFIWLVLPLDFVSKIIKGSRELGIDGNSNILLWGTISLLFLGFLFLFLLFRLKGVALKIYQVMHLAIYFVLMPAILIFESLRNFSSDKEEIIAGAFIFLVVGILLIFFNFKENKAEKVDN